MSAKNFKLFQHDFRAGPVSPGAYIVPAEALGVFALKGRKTTAEPFGVVINRLRACAVGITTPFLRRIALLFDVSPLRDRLTGKTVNHSQTVNDLKPHERNRVR